MSRSIPDLATTLDALQVPARIVDVLGQQASDAPLTVAGWARSVRHSKRVSFIALTDGSCLPTLQVVVGAELPNIEALRETLGTGCSVRVVGRLVASQGRGQSVELVAEQVEVLGEADPERYPLQKKGHTLEFLRSIVHLRGRSNTFGAVWRIRSTLAQTTHAFFAQHGLAYVHTPILTTSDCEGAGEMFEVVHTGGTEAPALPVAAAAAATGADADAAHFFGRRAYLTVSGQLAGESLAYALGRIYTFGPTFRAENSNTARHLAEFWMIEPEMAFFDLRANMALAEAYLRACIEAVLAQHRDDLAFLAEHHQPGLPEQLSAMVAQPFARVTYTEAVEILEAADVSFAFPVAWGKDLQSEHERYLAEVHFERPVIVTDYPTELKSFYMYQNDDGRTVAAMDVLVPRIGEIIGGSQREHRHERLLARIEALQMDPAAYDWYLDVQRYGAVPHAGFGLGFERLVMLCTGMANIRDVVPFPRAPGLAPG